MAIKPFNYQDTKANVVSGKTGGGIKPFNYEIVPFKEMAETQDITSTQQLNIEENLPEEFPKDLKSLDEVNAEIYSIEKVSPQDGGYDSGARIKLKVNLEKSLGEQGKSAELYFDSIPTKDEVVEYIKQERESRGISETSNKKTPEEKKIQGKEVEKFEKEIIETYSKNKDAEEKLMI